MDKFTARRDVVGFRTSVIYQHTHNQMHPGLSARRCPRCGEAVVADLRRPGAGTCRVGIDGQGGVVLAELLDLTDVLGEGGCVTLVRRGLIEVMSAMGVEGVREVRWVEVADRLGELPRAELRDLPVMMLARSLPSGWTVVVEVDGWTGWVGAQRDVLERLSEGGGAAASLWRSPNNEEVLYAEDGEVLGGFDPTTGHRWGAHQDKFGPVAEALGFSLSGVEDQGEDLLPLSVGQRCACALEALTGVRLTRAMFDDPWQGGLRRV